MKKQVIIVGGGFGGLKAAKVLSRYPDLFDVVLIDRRNYHLFQPLLYQVATAGLSPADIAAPIRGVLSNAKNITVLLEEVVSVNPERKSITTKNASARYDYLILASGATHSYFGKSEWEEFAPGLKTLEMATEIRRRILMAFETAEKEFDDDRQKPWITFVVVGAGPTGVEMAGAIAEIARNTLRKDFRHIDPKEAKVILVEAGGRVLSSFHASLSQSAEEDLNEMGVTVMTGTMVTQIDGDGVLVKQGEDIISIKSKTVIWAAGVKASPINETLGCELDRLGRVIVTDCLHLPNYLHTFVVGDQAHFEGKDKKALPGLAPVALQQGAHAAYNILAQVKNKKMKCFTYRDKGQMATIGRKLAVMEFRGIKAKGMLAWMAWLFVHIYYLIGFKNRFLVIFQWFWSYMTFSRGARLITTKDWRD